MGYRPIRFDEHANEGLPARLAAYCLLLWTGRCLGGAQIVELARRDGIAAEIDYTQEEPFPLTSVMLTGVVLPAEPIQTRDDVTAVAASLEKQLGTTLTEAREKIERQRVDLAAGILVVDWDGCVRHWQDEGLHRTDGPAVTVTADAGTVEAYFLHGSIGREDGPAIVLRRADGSRVETWLYADNTAIRNTISTDGTVTVERIAHPYLTFNSAGDAEYGWYWEGWPAEAGEGALLFPRNMREMGESGGLCVTIEVGDCYEVYTEAWGSPPRSARELIVALPPNPKRRWLRRSA